MSMKSVECAGTSFSLHLEELKTIKSERLWLDQVREHCLSEDFRKFCERSGMIGPSFEWHSTSDHIFKRFVDVCRANTDRCVAVVFHGTATFNVSNILYGGLDPKKRRGQAYGKGEYFGKNPGTSSSYCKGGKQMCVFLVIVPEHPASGSTAATLRKPHEMLVVENNHHQLPLGALKFTAVNNLALNASYQIKSKLQQLNLEAFEKEKQAMEGTHKAKIIQLIIQRELEHAANIYNRRKSHFSIASKKEIAMYAYEGYDEEFLSYFFEGGLPKPNKGHANQEFNSTETRTVEQLKDDWQKAVSKLDEESKRATSAGQSLPSPVAHPRNAAFSNASTVVGGGISFKYPPVALNPPAPNSQMQGYHHSSLGTSSKADVPRSTQPSLLQAVAASHQLSILASSSQVPPPLFPPGRSFQPAVNIEQNPMNGNLEDAIAWSQSPR